MATASLTVTFASPKQSTIPPAGAFSRPTTVFARSNLPSRRQLPAKIYCEKTRPESTPPPKRTLPGPAKLPLIGNIHNLIGSLPHQALRDLAIEYGPLIHLQLGEISAAVVSNPAMAQEIMKTHDLVFADRPRLLASEIATWGSQDIAFSPHGEYWKQMKRISLTELLGPRKVKSFRAIREAEVSDLVETVKKIAAAGEAVNITEMVMNVTNGITCKTAFGYQCTDQDEFIQLTKEAVSAASGFGITDLYPSLGFLQGITGVMNKLLKLRGGLDRIFDKIIKEHKDRMEKRGGELELEDEDLMDVLLRIQGSGGLKCPITSTNIKAVLVDLFIAGTDTSSTTVEWAMSEMMKNPRVMKKAQSEIREAAKGKSTINEDDIKDLPYLNAVIKETFRLHPPAPLLLPRESKADCVVAGYEIPKKTKVIVNAWAIGRDPATWKDAERFVPERFDGSEIDFKGMHFELIPFGAGRRICPGIAFGMANVELPVAQLLYNFDWELPRGVSVEEFDMTENFAATMGRKNPLCLVPRIHRFARRTTSGENSEEVELVV
ncbi:Desmethyl-deoxy-podophyllotoxin synthase [Linum perenne]